MANMYWATALTGGGTGALDAISVTDAVGNSSLVPLQAGDACFVVSPDTGADFFVLMDEAGATEDGREVIIPDDNTGNLWWKRVQIGVPAGVGVIHTGTTVPEGWTKFDGTTGAMTPGALIIKL